ncbi:MAG: hypothetical protein AB7G36_18850 [Candidatus Nanopelagicales bacterium]
MRFIGVLVVALVLYGAIRGLGPYVVLQATNADWRQRRADLHRRGDPEPNYHAAIATPGWDQLTTAAHWTALVGAGVVLVAGVS